MDNSQESRDAADAPESSPAPLGARRSGTPAWAWGACLALLVLHGILALTAASQKSWTYDEQDHLFSGYGYWAANDYRQNPEAGNLPQRWASLPLVLGQAAGLAFPSLAARLLGRMMITILSLGLGFLVFLWSKSLFGIPGGLASLFLYALSPTMLAHGALVTSDLCAVLFFLAAVGALGLFLKRVTWLTLAAPPVAIAGLLLSKMSGVLILPMAAVLLGWRLARGAPLEVRLFVRMLVAGRARQAAILLALLAIQALLVLVLIWGAYGFRYEAANPRLAGQGPSMDWAGELNGPTPFAPWMAKVRNAHFLPEAYVFGFTYMLNHSVHRRAFAAGRHGAEGWWWFFPFCFAVKTPLSLFFLLALSGFCLRLAHPPDFWARTAPLWALLAVYWAAALPSGMNVGHRHILVTYPVLFILAGGVGSCLWRKQWPGICALACLGVFAAESFSIRPHYLAFFNAAAGGPGNGHRLLVDSSLDWGQDLPALKQWLDHNASPEQPFYLSYFGQDEPESYGIKARMLAQVYYVEDVRAGAKPQTLEPGLYCISATILEQVMSRVAFGQWSRPYESAYQGLNQAMAELAGDSPPALTAFEKARLFTCFEEFRLARLCHFLKKRRPDAHAGYSILIYNMNGDDLVQALWGDAGPLPDDPQVQWKSRGPQDDRAAPGSLLDCGEAF